MYRLLFRDPAAATYIPLLAKTAELFNHALDGPGELPTWLRTGYATQLYKGTGSSQDPRQYRILVIRSVLAKLLEKMIELRGRAHHQQGLLHISHEQAGFMPGRMAHDNLIIITTRIQTSRNTDMTQTNRRPPKGTHPTPPPLLHQNYAFRQPKMNDATGQPSHLNKTAYT